jgi:spermidine/putrescine-binding protein
VSVGSGGVWEVNGPTGVTYRTDKISHVSETWNDFWTHPEAKGHIYLLDQIEETIGASLLRDKNPLNSGNTAQVMKASTDLVDLRSQLGGYSTDTQTLMQTGQAWLAHSWVTGAYLGIEASKDKDVWRFYFPKDGAPIGCDTLSIGRKSKSPGTALLFIDWVLRPDNNEALAKFALQKTGTTAGDAAFDHIVEAYPFFKYSDEVLRDPSLWKVAPTGARAQLYNEQWARIKA